MVAFAGERVLELEAPIRNDGTKATLAGWGRTQDDVEGGRRRLEPAMVRECFEYLFSKVSERASCVLKKIRWLIDRYINKQAYVCVVRLVLGVLLAEQQCNVHAQNAGTYCCCRSKPSPHRLSML